MIPSATPMAAPVIKPRMVTLVMDGVLPTNRKPATAIHEVQRTMRMFMVYSNRQRAALIAIACRCTQAGSNQSLASFADPASGTLTDVSVGGASPIWQYYHYPPQGFS